MNIHRTQTSVSLTNFKKFKGNVITPQYKMWCAEGKYSEKTDIVCGDVGTARARNKFRWICTISVKFSLNNHPSLPSSPNP